MKYKAFAKSLIAFSILLVLFIFWSQPSEAKKAKGKNAKDISTVVDHRKAAKPDFVITKIMVTRGGNFSDEYARSGRNGPRFKVSVKNIGTAKT